ncbi:MAG: 50S ribosomal protein L10 [Rikenellaceae bacterium]
MKREEKLIIVNSLAEKLQQFPHFYVTGTAGFNAEQTAALRRKCFEYGVQMVVVKNTLFKRALAQVECQDIDGILATLTGTSAIMFTTVGNAPAKLIKEMAKSGSKPELKSAYVEQCAYIGAENLEALVNVKSRDELIADVIALLQSPAKNVISALQSSGHTLSGLVKTLSER